MSSKKIEKIFNFGFSLIEVVIVVAIVIILTVIIFATISPAQRMASMRDNQRESFAHAIWHSVEERRQRERGGWEREDCDPLPSEETLIASDGYNLYAWIYDGYLKTPFTDPIHESAYFASVNDYNTGTFYLAIDHVGNIYIKIKGETRDIYIGTEPDDWPEYLISCNTVGPGSIEGPCGSSAGHGENVTFTATPVSGHNFSHWSGDAWGMNESFTFIGVRKEKTITANFLDACGGKTVLNYAGHNYNIAPIGEEDSQQCWMIENMNYAVNNCSEGEEASCWCYNEESANCDIYGLLYSIDRAEEVCPSGWRLPTDDDWKDLELYLSMDQDDLDDVGWRGHDEEVGIKLVEGEFNALFGGMRTISEGEGDEEAEYFNLEDAGFWWAANPFYKRHIVDNEEQKGVNRQGCSTTDAYSVRCVKDH